MHAAPRQAFPGDIAFATRTVITLAQIQRLFSQGQGAPGYRVLAEWR